jgi:predicted metal-binding membrane protein
VSAERRLAMTTGGLLLLLAGVAWIELAVPLAMPSEPGLSPPSAGFLFLATWVVMTVAMMVPATLPVLLLHRTHAANLGSGPVPTLVLLGGYLLVWSAAGIAALAAQASATELVTVTGSSLASVAWLVLVLAGFYQLTPLKAACLRACRNPLTVLFESPPGNGLRRELARGLRHGAWCLACCWPLMAVLLLVSFMNLTWMAIVTVVFMLEKNHLRGPVVARAAGALLVLLGIAGLVHPELLTWLSGGMPPTVMGSGI